MSQALQIQDLYFTPEEYLAAERVSETRHEYLAGAVYAMAGASRAHDRISSNINAALVNQLDGKPCEPFTSDMRLRIRRPGATFYYYADAGVDCSGSNEDEVDAPTVIFEVLSPATERIDRGDKLVNYQAIPTMRVYVLVNQFVEAVTVYRRREGDAWEVELLADRSAILELPEIECSIPLRSIYARVFR